MRIVVSDHAVLRFLERSGGFDVESLRKQIAERCKPAMRTGATSLKFDGGKFTFSDNRLTVTSFVPDTISQTQQDGLGRRRSSGVASHG